MQDETFDKLKTSMEEGLDHAKGNKVLTETTSVAQQEELTGQKMNVPSADELVKRASSAFIRNKKMFTNAFAKLSARSKTRVMNAVLDLPVDGVPVYLKTEEEKIAFAVGQRCISDRFIITQHYINEEVSKARAAQKEKAEKDPQDTTVAEKTLDNKE